jgi:hypothetical protein
MRPHLPSFGAPGFDATSRRIFLASAGSSLRRRSHYRVKPLEQRADASTCDRFAFSTRKVDRKFYRNERPLLLVGDVHRPPPEIGGPVSEPENHHHAIGKDERSRMRSGQIAQIATHVVRENLIRSAQVKVKSRHDRASFDNDG